MNPDRKLIQLFIRWLSYEHPPSSFPLSDFNRVRYEIRPGDVLLMEGRSRVSEVIKMVTQSCWSHAALYIGRVHDIEDLESRKIIQQHYQGPPDAHLIIESLIGKGTQVVDLESYCHDHLRICRPRGMAHRDITEVIRYTVSRIGYDYDIRQILDLARYLFPWGVIPRQYRSSLFRHSAGSHTKIICSTLLAEAFDNVHFPILPNIQHTPQQGIEFEKSNPRLITPSDFDYSPYFEIIKCPPIELATPAAYRTLPWKDSMIRFKEREVVVEESEP